MRPCSVQGILHFAFQKDLQGTTFSEICQRNHLNGQLQGGLKITWHLSKSVPLDICHPDSSRAQHPWCYQQLAHQVPLIAGREMSGVQMVISTYRKWGETRGGLGGLGIQAAQALLTGCSKSCHPGRVNRK